MSSEINPFELYTPSPATRELEKDILYRQLTAFLQYKSLADMMVRLHRKSPTEPDFKVRDLFHTGLFLEEKGNPSFFFYGKQHFKDMKTLDSLKVYEKIHDECLYRKKEFWNKHKGIVATTETQVESQKLIKQTINSQLLPHRLFFSTIALGIAIRYNMWMGKSAYAFILFTTAYWLGGNMAKYANASMIFNEIPRLPDPEIERERQDIVNYCFLFDADIVSKTFLLKKNRLKQDATEPSPKN